MIQIASLAQKFLKDDDQLDIGSFIASQQQSDHGYCGRSPASDLYYTLFALSSLAALGKYDALKSVFPYLEDQQNKLSQLDFIHTAALLRCHTLLVETELRVKAKMSVSRLEWWRCANGGFNADRIAIETNATVYHSFIAYLTYIEAGLKMTDGAKLLQSVMVLRAADGGFTNEPTMPHSITTATSAAILLQQWIAGETDQSAINALLGCEVAGGGFRSFPNAPLPDLLSTATALYALRVCNVKTKHRNAHLNFIEALWDNNGGFCGDLSDSVSDCEYTFYALLALGALADA
jgi:prenyltransferase beta subunit